MNKIKDFSFKSMLESGVIIMIIPLVYFLFQGVGINSMPLYIFTGITISHLYKMWLIYDEVTKNNNKEEYKKVAKQTKTTVLVFSVITFILILLALIGIFFSEEIIVDEELKVAFIFEIILISSILLVSLRITNNLYDRLFEGK
ncbi:hypothetical protein ACNSOS_11090 [Aliarcobacter vitoriensis]|uniref:hypothetical protein n=1 Tax=Aliarcobacter vitoriensis TaxID=2011099 RepID=UPI003AAF8FA8